jgi:hypothetical protein
MINLSFVNILWTIFNIALWIIIIALIVRFVIKQIKK